MGKCTAWPAVTHGGGDSEEPPTATGNLFMSRPNKSLLCQAETRNHFKTTALWTACSSHAGPREGVGWGGKGGGSLDVSLV